MQKPIIKRTPLIRKSLAIVLASLSGEEVKVELQNDDEITGILISADSAMDMKLANVAYVNSTALPSSRINSKNSIFDPDSLELEDNSFERYMQNNLLEEMNSLLVYGHDIRFVHIPAHINITSHLSQFMRKYDSLQSVKRSRTSEPTKTRAKLFSSEAIDGTSDWEMSGRNDEAYEELVVPVKSLDHNSVVTDSSSSSSSSSSR